MNHRPITTRLIPNMNSNSNDGRSWKVAGSVKIRLTDYQMQWRKMITDKFSIIDGWTINPKTNHLSSFCILRITSFCIFGWYPGKFLSEISCQFLRPKNQLRLLDGSRGGVTGHHLGGRSATVLLEMRSTLLQGPLCNAAPVWRVTDLKATQGRVEPPQSVLVKLCFSTRADGPQRRQHLSQVATDLLKCVRLWWWGGPCIGVENQSCRATEQARRTSKMLIPFG